MSDSVYSVEFISLDEVRQYSLNYCRTHFPKRFERSLRYVFEEDRLRCLGAGILLYENLSLEDKDILITEYGKPYSAVSDNDFSISHSGDYVALAESVYPGVRIGIDIEKIDPRHIDIASNVFCREELAWFDGAAHDDKLRRFFALWTMKESVSKALGIGLSIDYRSLNIMQLIRSGHQLIEGCNFTGESIDVPGYGASLVYCCTEL